MIDYEISSFAPNWEDGMKVGAKEFNQLNAFILAWLEASFMATNGGRNWGLIPNAEFKFVHQASENQLCLICCQAVTASGRRIEITPHTTGLGLGFPSLKWELPKGDKNLVLEVSCFDKDSVAFGAPQGAGNPRYPFAIYEYQLKAIDAKTSPSIHQLKVGEWRSGALNSDYIPPCMAMNSHSQLKAFWEKAFAHFDELCSTAKKVQEKYLDSNGALTVEAKKLVDRILPELFDTRTYLQTYGLTLSPQAFFSLIASWPARLEVAFMSGLQGHRTELDKVIDIRASWKNSDVKGLQFELNDMQPNLHKLINKFLYQFEEAILKMQNDQMQR